MYLSLIEINRFVNLHTMEGKVCGMCQKHVPLRSLRKRLFIHLKMLPTPNWNNTPNAIPQPQLRHPNQSFNAHHQQQQRNFNPQMNMNPNFRPLPQNQQFNNQNRNFNPQQQNRKFNNNQQFRNNNNNFIPQGNMMNPMNQLPTSFGPQNTGKRPYNANNNFNNNNFNNNNRLVTLLNFLIFFIIKFIFLGAIKEAGETIITLEIEVIIQVIFISK